VIRATEESATKPPAIEPIDVLGAKLHG